MRCRPYCFEKVIDVRSFVDEEANGMPLDLHAHDEVGRTGRLDGDHARETVVVRVNQRFVQVQHEDFLRQEICNERTCSGGRAACASTYGVDGATVAAADSCSI